MRRWLYLVLIIGLAQAVPLRAAGSFAEQLAALQSPLAADPTNKTILFKLGDLCFDEGARDNRKAVVLAEKYFTQLIALDPTNALALVMLGSTFTMKGRDAFWPTTRLSWVNEGIKKMDAAVAMAPDNPLVRFTRAINNYHMPKIMGREEVVKKDFAWLWQNVETASANLEVEVKQNIAFCQGMLLKKQRRLPAAAEVWKKGIAFNLESSLAAQMSDQLNQLGGHEKE